MENIYEQIIQNMFITTRTLDIHCAVIVGQNYFITLPLVPGNVCNIHFRSGKNLSREKGV